MQYIPTNIKINLEWTVKKGIGNEAEDFSRSTVSLFLFNDENRWAVPCTADYTGLVKAELPETLEEGVYSLELLWIKNDKSINETRCVQRTRKTCVFAIGAGVSLTADTRAVSPMPDIPPIEAPDPIPTVKMVTVAAPYGYDGLSAYEIAVLRGKTNLSEEEWVGTGGASVINSLDSFSTNAALSANMGRELADMIATGNVGAENDLTPDSIKPIQTGVITRVVNEIKQQVQESITKTPQMLNEQEKQQTRANIGAFSEEEGEVLNDRVLDRAYAQGVGMGYVVLDRHKSFASQVTKSNTIYEIRYDFKITSNVTLKDNVVLLFNGGCLYDDTKSSYQIKSGKDCVIKENGQRIFDYVIPYKFTNEIFAASSFGITPQNQTDNAARFNYVSRFCSIKLDVAGTSGENYYKVEAPLMVTGITGRKLLGYGNSPNLQSVVVPKEEFPENRGVIETENYWLGLEGGREGVNPYYNTGYEIRGIRILCNGLASYGVVAWASGSHSHISDMGVTDAMKACYFMGGLNVNASLYKCSGTTYKSIIIEGTTPEDTIEVKACFLYIGRHPNDNFAPGYGSESGGNGSGGLVSVVNCSGDAADVFRFDSGSVLSVSDCRFEQIDRLFVSEEDNPGGGAVTDLIFSGGSIEFNPNSSHRVALYSKKYLTCMLTLIASHLFGANNNGVIYYADIKRFEKNAVNRPAINLMTSGPVVFDGEIMAHSLITGLDASGAKSPWQTLRLGAVKADISTSLNEGDKNVNVVGFTTNTDKDMAFLYRGKLAWGGTNANGLILYNPSSPADALTYTHVSNLMKGQTALRPGEMTRYGRSYKPNGGLPYFDTDLKRMIWWSGLYWMDEKGNNLTNVTRTKGTTAQREAMVTADTPIGVDNAGFQYYDTTLKKYVLWNGTEWTNLDGSALS